MRACPLECKKKARLQGSAKWKESSDGFLIVSIGKVNTLSYLV